MSNITDHSTALRSADSTIHRLSKVILARPTLVVGLLGLGAIVFVAIFASVLTTHDPLVPDVIARRLPPLWEDWLTGTSLADPSHPLGTDNLGRDYWARLAYGARISLWIGLAGAFVSTFVGSLIGISAGYFGGRVDMAATFLIQTRLSMPVILAALAAVAAFGGSLTLLVILCGTFLWDRAAVVTRSVTKQIASREYITAAKALGSSDLSIILTEVLPNLITPLAIVLTIEIGQTILFEAALSFLGLGVPPPTPSWGLMLAEAKEDIFFSPWAILMPGACLFMLVLFTSLIGDSLQDDSARIRP